MNLTSYLLVALGCALGGISRFWLCNFSASLGWALLGTLSVNVLGCFLAGLTTSLILNLWQNHHELLRLLLIVGFLGGLTTFSAFSLDILALGKDTQITALILHIVLNVSLSILGMFIGYILGSELSSQLMRI